MKSTQESRGHGPTASELRKRDHVECIFAHYRAPDEDDWTAANEVESPEATETTSTLWMASQVTASTAREGGGDWVPEARRNHEQLCPECFLIGPATQSGICRECEG
jgi:hypothetical protein